MQLVRTPVDRTPVDRSPVDRIEAQVAGTRVEPTHVAFARLLSRVAPVELR